MGIFCGPSFCILYCGTSDLCGGSAGVRAVKLKVIQEEENEHYKQEDRLIKLSKGNSNCILSMRPMVKARVWVQ